jgi:hypothetical protein
MRIYLAITFWGEEYRRYFLDYCLASLLAPGNLPAITDKAGARLLIATNDRDWAALQTEPTFIAAKKLISIEQVPFSNKSYSNAHEKMLVMSDAHRRLARKMFEQRAHGIFLYPDTIIAMGFISKLEELWRSGTGVVMFMNVRFANEGLISEVKRRGLIKPGEPIGLSSAELVRLTIRHMHSEMKRSGFENNCEDYGSSSYFWVVTPGEDLLFHCGSWIPALIDYGSIDKHDDTTFESCTLDGDYVAKNLSGSKGVHFVRDTGELFLISFTPESTVNYLLTPCFRYRLPPLRAALKILHAHDFLYKQGTLDWLRKEQFRLPVRFRGGNAPDSRWRDVECRAAGIIKRMERSGNLSDKIVYFGYFVGYILPIRLPIILLKRCGRIVRSLWINHASITRRIVQILHGDHAAWNRATWRIRQIWNQLLGRAIREPEPNPDYSQR